MPAVPRPPTWTAALLATALCACRAPAVDPGPTDEPPPSDTPTLPGPQTVRLAVWNIQSVGSESSDQYAAAQEVLRRIDADVVGLNEVDSGEAPAVLSLAEALGYDVVIVPDSNPFGGLRNALLSRLPVASSDVPTAAELSGDPAANDLTRLPVTASISAGTRGLLVVVQHWKSGWDDDDEFRRAVDAHRTAQAAGGGAGAPVIMGDINSELDDRTETPASFTALPGGMPSGYWLGADLYDSLPSGLDNDAFAPLEAAGLVSVDARQLDGRDATRDPSGRRLDYVWLEPGLAAGARAEVYDSRDEVGGLPKAGTAPPRETSLNASDHLPVIVELDLP